MQKIRFGKMYFFVLVFLLLALMFSLPGFAMYRNTRSLFIQSLANSANNTALTIARFIEDDIDSYLALIDIDDYETDAYDEVYYQKMLSMFQTIKEQTQAEYVYTQKRINDNQFVYIFDGENPTSEWFSPIGSIDDMDATLRRAYDEGIIIATDMEQDDYWGMLLTGYAPIFNQETGEVIGMVGVDFSYDHVEGVLKSIRNAIIIIVILMITLSSIIFYNLINFRFNMLEIDFVTKLASRRQYEQRLKDAVRNARLFKNALSVMMIDIDGFKAINDKCGHDFGDIVLRHVAHLIKDKATRSSDVCARYGGDEFTIILPNANKQQAIEVGGRILRELEHRDNYKGDLKDFHTSVSIGIVEMGEDMKYDKMTNFADRAMYISKNKGKNQITVYQH